MIVSITVGLPVLSPTPASAASLSDMTPTEKAQSWAYLNATRKCIRDSLGMRKTIDVVNFGNLHDGYWKDIVEEGSAASGHWWKDDFKIESSYLMTVGDDGKASCNDILKSGAQAWGYGNDFMGLLCSFMPTRDNGSTCRGGSGWFSNLGGRADAFDQVIKDRLYGGQGARVSNVELYPLYKAVFLSDQGCKVKASTVAPGQGNGDLIYRDIKIVDPATGQVTVTTFEGVSHGTTKSIYTDNDLSVNQQNCGYIADRLNEYANDYADAIIVPKKPDTPPAAGKDCALKPDALGCTKGDTTTCAIDGIGWMLCPVIKFVAGLADSMFTVLSNNFLKIGTSVVNTDPAKGATTTYEAWKAMQSIANVILVIAFLFVIFSQLTSVGLSNLGVKKMLPKIIIAAILMNVSFYLCQIAVDLSNILGYSLKDMLTGLASQASSGSGNAIDAASGNVLGGTNGWGNLAGGILAAGTAVVAGYFMLSMLGGLLLAAVLALFMILLILIARQGIIVLAIVVAPIAIAFWLLPNTKNLASIWWKIFSRMLLLFPIISLIFGASTLASVVLRDSFGSFTEANGNVNWLGQIVAAGIQVIPLFATPLALKGALAAVPMVGNLATKMSGRANANVGKKFGDSYRGSVFGRGRAIRRQARANYRDRQFAERIEAGGAASLAAGGLAGLGWTKSQRAQKEAIVRAASGTAASAQSEAVKQQMKVLQDHVGTNPDDILKHIESSHGSMSDTDMQAASDLLLASVGVAELRKIMQNPAVMQRHARSVVESSRRNESVVRQKAPDLANWASTVAATGGSAYAGETIAQTYAGAQASKLIDLDPSSAEAGRAHIDPAEARRALESVNAGSMKPGTRRVLQGIVDAGGGGASPAPSGGRRLRDRIADATGPEADAEVGGPVETPSQRAAREAVERRSQENGDADAWARWREQQQAKEAGGSSVDDQGRQTPNGAGDDYHDRMNH